jgi:hypothetical protein
MATKRRAPAVWFVAVLAAMSVLLALKMSQGADHDLFWQLKEGERVVVEHRWPTVETDSFTAAGKTLPAAEWLSETISYLVYRAGGYGGLVLFNSALFAAALLLAGALLARRSGPLEGAALLCLVFFGFLNFYAIRAQNWTILFTALFLYLCALWEDGARWAPWAMAATLLPWANLHGGFMLGLGVLGLLCGAEAWRTRRAAALAPLGLGTLLCCVHPDGVDALVYPLWFMAFPPPGRALILEWRPVNFTEITATPYLLILGALAWCGAEGGRSRFPWGVLTLALAVAALRGRKLLPEFTLAAAALLAGRARGPWLAAAAALSIAVPAWVVFGGRSALSWDLEARFPRRAVELLRQMKPDAHVFNNYDWGGYLIYKLSPRAKVFIDGRLDPYWSLLPGDYATIREKKPGWRERLDAYGADAALLRPTDRLGEGLLHDPAWKLLYADERSVLFVR